MPQLGDLVELAVRGAGVAALGAALGVCLGALVRNQVVAIVGVLLLSFLLEPLLLGLAPDVGRFGPLVALPTAAAGLSPADTGLGDVTLVAPGVAVLLMLAWIGVTFAASVAVYDVRPGLVRTDMTADATQDKDALIARGAVPMPRWGEPEDIGRTVAALASGAIPYATGSVLFVDGGFNVKRF